MIYLDNAATTFIKPKPVYDTLDYVTRKLGANAGRGGHRLSIGASNLVYDAAETVAELFNIENPQNIAFCQNTTMALNMAIKGVYKKGDHIIISSMEHNSVARPVTKISGGSYSIVKADECGFIRPSDVEALIRPNTKLIVINHASNVCGSIADIEEIGKIAKKHNVLFLVDSAQSGGSVPIDVKKYNIDMLAFAGHKGLMGPLGTGGLYVRDGIDTDTLLEGGSGSMSESMSQPDYMPDRLVSGTVNTPAIAALKEGVRFVIKTGVEEIARKENELARRFLNGVGNMENVVIYGDSSRPSVAVVSLNVKGIDPVLCANMLDENYGICVRSGLHCAPLAHKTLGTLPAGTVRFSFGFFNTNKDVDRAVDALNRMAETK